MAGIRVLFKQKEPISEFDLPEDEAVIASEHEAPKKGRGVEEPTNPLDVEMSALSRRFMSASESHLFIVPFIVSGIFGLIANITNVELKSLLEQHAIKKSEKDGEVEFELPEDHEGKLWTLVEKLNSAHYTLGSYQRSLIIQLSTLFDILIAGLVKQIIAHKPSVMEASDRKVDFADLAKFTDMDDLRRFFFDKTIDSVVRKSRSDQFNWLENKLGIPLTKGLDGWSEYIEINERRNLFTHTEGHITKEYIENCAEAGCNVEKIGSVGERLRSSPKYVTRASELFFIIGQKLLQVVWRKLSEDFCNGSLNQADMELINCTYELNRNEKYKISSAIGQFACGGTIKRYSGETTKRILYVNFAASLMLQEKIKDARDVLARLDWDVVNHEFAISVNAIRGDVKEVCRLMPLAFKSGDMQKSCFQEWPVFFEVRKDERFLTAYKDLFSEEFKSRPSPKNIDATQRREIVDPIRTLVQRRDGTEVDSKNLH